MPWNEIGQVLCIFALMPVMGLFIAGLLAAIIGAGRACEWAYDRVMP